MPHWVSLELRDSILDGLARLPLALLPAAAALALATILLSIALRVPGSHTLLPLLSAPLRLREEGFAPRHVPSRVRGEPVPPACKLGLGLGLGLELGLDLGWG